MVTKNSSSQHVLSQEEELREIMILRKKTIEDLASIFGSRAAQMYISGDYRLDSAQIERLGNVWKLTPEELFVLRMAGGEATILPPRGEFQQELMLLYYSLWGHVSPEAKGEIEDLLHQIGETAINDIRSRMPPSS